MISLRNSSSTIHIYNYFIKAGNTYYTFLRVRAQGKDSNMVLNRAAELDEFLTTNGGRFS